MGVSGNMLYDIILPVEPSVGTIAVNSTLFVVDCGLLPDAKQVAYSVLVDGASSSIIVGNLSEYTFSLGSGSNFNATTNPIRASL